MIKLKREAESGQLKGFLVRADGMVMIGHRLCVLCGKIKEINYGRGSLFCICDASGKHKNVSYPKGILKVEGYKERCCRIYFQMSHLSKS